MLFYGPPGTDKTKITKRIINKVGLTEVCIPLSSVELNRSKVGETEHLFKRYFLESNIHSSSFMLYCNR